MNELDPPPSTIVEFTFQWKTWLNNLYEWLKSANGSVVPSMTTTERDAMTAKNGMIIYNTTTNAFNFFENGLWVTK